MLAGGLLLLTGRLSAQQGLLGEYFNGTNFERKVTSRIDPEINFTWFGVSPAPGMPFSDYSIRWTGRLLAPKTGKYVFSAKVDDGIRVWVGGKKVVDAWGLNDYGSYSGATQLTANQYYDLKVEYFNAPNEGEVQLMWTLPSQEVTLPGAFGPQPEKVPAKYFYRSGTATPAQPAATNPPKKTDSPQKQAAVKPKPAKPTKPQSATKPKPAPEASATELKAKQKALELKYIYFVRSKDAILPESQATLRDWVTFLQQKPEATIDIAGHTDDLGNDEKNQKLSEERAQIVADYLVAHGLDRSRIRTKGYGGTRPIYVNPATEQERALNRRVEIRAK